VDNTFDKMYYSQGRHIAGVDESGVSDIAGPLVAACVILPYIDVHKDDLRIFEVNDSKQVPEKYRKQHAEVIWQTATAIGIGEVQPADIDYLGIIEATKLAMYRAIAACKTVSKGKTMTPDFVMIDKINNFTLNIKPRQTLIEQGDTKSLCIASASIVAKVYRDEIMLKLDNHFPYYSWAKNKGYPCEDHFKGIDEHGVQIGIHRIKRWPFIKNPSLPEDHSLWERRRKQWKRITLKKMQLETAPELWSLRPQYLKSYGAS
jgi:ribonuclease HII